MSIPDTLPCICTNPNCRHQFPTRNPIAGGGSNFTFVGNMTSCPKCGHTARYADWSTDSQGKFYFHDFFSFISEFKNLETLKNIKSELEAANDRITATELADTLVEIDSSFAKFRELISSIPVGAVKNLIQTLIMILTLVVMHQASMNTDKQHEETTSLLKQQQELEKEKFEYQKQRDAIEDKEKHQAKIEREELEKKIQELESSFEKKLRTLEKSKEHTDKPEKKLKGSDRNKPCPCGSGKKAKKCHLNGF